MRRNLPTTTAWCLVVAFGMLAIGAPLPAAGQASAGPTFDRVIGVLPDAGLLNTPMGVTVSPSNPNRIFVVDYGNARIQVFRTTGRPDLGYWGSRGEGLGEFWQPMDIEASPDGRFIYVVDAGRARVMQYELDRLCIGEIDVGCENRVRLEWGSYGSGPGAFRAPTGLAVDRKGRVYVADEAAGNIQVFEADGSNPRILTDADDGPGRLNHPRDIEVDAEGKIWVADTENHRIVVLDQEGQLLTQVLGGVDGFYKPTGIAVGPDGSFIVRDFDPSYRTPRLWRYDENGRLEGSLIQMEGYDKRSRYPLQGVDFMPDGTAVVANPYAGITHLGEPQAFEISLYLLPDGGDALQPLAARGRAPGQFAHPSAVAIGKRYVVVGDTDNQRVQILDAELGYTPSRVIGAPELELDEIAGVAIFDTGSALTSRIYVSDRERNQVFVLDPTGAVLATWGDGRSRDFNKPGGMAVDAEGRVYVADTNNRRVVVRSPEGEELRSFGRDELSQPDGVAIGPEGLIYVIERGRSRLMAFDEAGTAVALWDAEPSDFARPEPGEMSKPVSIAADDRYLYILENTGFLHARVQVLRPEVGKPLSESVVAVFAASEGAGPGLVYDPFGVAAHPDGRVIVADSGNNRLQLFRWPDEGPDEVPTPTAEPTDEPSPEPTDEPDPQETPESTPEVSPTPTDEPDPGDDPSPTPTDEPTAEPTEAPTDEPTPASSAEPTADPTRTPTDEPDPTVEPSPTEDRSTRINPLLTIYFPQLVKHR